MASTFPTALDTIPDAPTTPALGGSTPTHPEMHDLLKDAIIALETKVGVTSSAVPTSLDYRINAAEGDIQGVFLALGYTEGVDTFSTSSYWNVSQTGLKTASTSSITAAQTVATLLDLSATNTGADATLGTTYHAVKFVCPAAPDNTVGDLVFRAKRSGTFTNPATQLFGDIYTDVAGLPGTKITNLTTGATIFGVIGTLGTSYADVPLGFNRTTLTPGTSFWAVFRASSTPAGASVVLDSKTGDGTQAATSSNGSAWSASTADISLRVRGQDYCAIYATTDTNVAVYGRSVEQSGVAGFSTNNSAVNGLSTNSYGVAGISTYSIGSFGKSTWSIGLQGISTYSQAGSFGVSGTLVQNTSSAGNVFSRTLAAAGFNVTGPLVRIQDNVSGAGTWQAPLVQGMIGATDRWVVHPLVPNTSGQIAYLHDTTNTLTTPGVRLASWKNGGVEKAWMGHDGTMRGQRFSPAVGSDRGDTNVTLASSSDAQVQRFSTTLTAARTITLSTTGAFAGDEFHVVRSAGGAFNLDLGGLKTMAAGMWAVVKYDGSAWFLSAHGTL